MNKTTSSYNRGDAFEIKAFHLFKSLLENDDFYVSGKKSKIFRKKGYYSEKRKTEIIFDIAIETYLNNSTSYSLLTLIECKNYQSPVPVSDLEEFDSKIRQISEHNTKGIVITNHFYQSGANSFAKSTGLALAKVNDNDEFEWIVNRKAGSDPPLTKSEAIKHLETEAYDSLNFVALNEDFALSTVAELLIQIQIIDYFVYKEKFITVPYVTKERINEIVAKLESYHLYTEKMLDENKICKFLQEKYPVSFYFDDTLPQNVLGKIEFDPLSIYVSKELKIDKPRWRFTLAHEIGHLILHSKLLQYKLSEKSDTEDTLSFKYFVSEMTSRRLEYQANLFAGTLLLPISSLIPLVNRYFTEERIHKGRLYWDNQPINQQLALNLLTRISTACEVSIEVARIRLITLDLLIDDRYKSLKGILREMKLL
jgi:Zn-dependent peptidase ImmA (M78 family)